MIEGLEEEVNKLELKLAELPNKDEIIVAATKIVGVFTGKKMKAYIRKAIKKVQEPFGPSHFVSSISYSRLGLISTPRQCSSTTPYSTSTVTRPHRSDLRDQKLSTGLQKRPPTTSLEQPHLKHPYTQWQMRHEGKNFQAPWRGVGHSRSRRPFRDPQGRMWHNSYHH